MNDRDKIVEMASIASLYNSLAEKTRYYSPDGKKGLSKEKRAKLRKKRKSAENEFISRKLL